MRKSSGAAAEAAKEMNKAFTQQMKRLRQNVNNILIEIGTALITELRPKIIIANEQLSKLGDIGWDNIASVLSQNWGLVLERLWELAKLGGIIIGESLISGLKSIITPDWWDAIFNTGGIEQWVKDVELVAEHFGITFEEAFAHVTSLSDKFSTTLINNIKASKTPIAKAIDEFKRLMTDGINFVAKEAEKLSNIFDFPEQKGGELKLDLKFDLGDADPFIEKLNEINTMTFKLNQKLAFKLKFDLSEFDVLTTKFETFKPEINPEVKIDEAAIKLQELRDIWKLTNEDIASLNEQFNQQIRASDLVSFEQNE